MTADIHQLPTSLTILAQQIRTELAADEAAEAWRTNRVELGIHLREARAAFSSNIAFSVWLAENGLEMDPDKRRALIEMAEHPDLMRGVYANTDYFKDRKILEDDFRPKLRHSPEAITPPDGPSPIEIAATPVIEPVIQQTPEPRIENQQAPSPALAPQPKKPEQAKGHNKGGAKPLLIIEHGVTGQAIVDWLRPLAEAKFDTDALHRAKIGRALAKLKTSTLKLVVEFVEMHRDELRPALGSEVYSAGLFWAEIPLALEKDISGHFSKSDQIIHKVIEQWDNRVVPVMRDWVAAGKPEDSNAWYKTRVRKPVLMAAPKISPELRAEAIAVGIDMNDQKFASLPEQSIRQIIANKTKPREYANEHDLFRLPDPAPIRVFGRDIWPCPQGHYWSWKDAFYAYHLWLEADNHLQGHEKRAAVRGRTLMNPFVPILTNINGAVGAAFKEMIWAQFHHEDKEADSFGPPKMLLFQGE